MNADESLWDQFNLAEQNPSPGGGILYCLRYSREHVEAHHKNVVDALRRMGITLQDAGEGIAVIPDRELDADEQERVMLLLEELSVQNEAIEYHDGGLGNCESIEDLRNQLISSVENCLDRGVQDLHTAFDLVTITIPQIVRDIRISHRQNNVLSAADSTLLDDLADYAQRRARMLNKPKVVILQA